MKLITKTVVLGLFILIISLPLALSASRTFYVQETDFVKITPTIVDLDYDKVSHNFSQPLDDEGEWQTGYNDAGEYTITIQATDGKDTTTEEVLLIVENKNQPPYLAEEIIILKETQKLDLTELVKDPDNDILTYSFPSPFDNNGVWNTNYQDAGEYTYDFTANDGEFTQTFRVQITIEETNQPPEIVDIFSSKETISVHEGEKLEFSVDVKEYDGETVTFLWKLNNRTISSGEDGKITFDFESAGQHTLTLIIFDGTHEITRTWIIIVDETNREPAISFETITVKEGETAVVTLPETDLDGDQLSYMFEQPLNEQGKWETTFEDAGTHVLDVKVSDGKATQETTVRIKVEDVDRAPHLLLPENVEVNENEFVSWSIETSDPDNDKVKVTFENLPADATFNPITKTVKWQPEFDFIRRSSGLISNILNSLRLERFLLSEKTIDVTVKACGKDLCSQGIVPITVYNQNRAPELDEFDPISIKETETIDLQASGSDPDGDIISYTYSDPLGKFSGEWKTDYEDEGNYTIWVTASDGFSEVNRAIGLTVLKNNRAPSLQIVNDVIVVNEGEEFSLHAKANDPDRDNVTLLVRNAPQGSHFKDGVFTWEASYDFVQNRSGKVLDDLVSGQTYINKKFNSEAREQWIEIVADDGEVQTSHPVKIVVKNVNQKPSIIDYTPIQNKIVANINQPIIFQVIPADADGDNVSISWSFGLKEPKIKNTNTVQRIFKAPGTKTVSVTLDDGRDTIRKVWQVDVKNIVVNQPAPKPQYEVGEILVYEIVY